MTWRVLTTPACEPDFQALRDEDRTAVIEDLFAWIAEGPPRSSPPGGWRKLFPGGA